MTDEKENRFWSKEVLEKIEERWRRQAEERGITVEELKKEFWDRPRIYSGLPLKEGKA